MWKRCLLLVVAVALLASGGCARVLMRTPVVVAEGLVDPFEYVAPERQGSVLPVFAASGRTASGRTDPARFYTSERSREVRLGIATIEIGSGMSWEELVQESRTLHRSSSPEVKLAAYEEYGPLWSTAWPPDYRFARGWEAPGVDREPARRFAEAIDEILDSSRRRQIMIFVHGFNTRFDENLKKTAEFWHFTARDGAVLSFDWPSRSNLFSYQKDKANAEFAVRQFRELLEFLATHTSVEEINIIAHSAGNPVAVEALRHLSLIHYDLDDEKARARTKIGRVVLAAPDMDLDAALSASVDGAGRVTKGVAVYASRRDRALDFSGDIFGNVRVGRSIGKLSEEERKALIAHNGQWIDVTNAQKPFSTFLGHSYYHDNPWVTSDMLIFLRLGATPEQRGLVRDAETGFLAFPDDYIGRLAEVAEWIHNEQGAAAAP